VGRLGRPQSPTKGSIIRKPRQLQGLLGALGPERLEVVPAQVGTSQRSLGLFQFS